MRRATSGLAIAAFLIGCGQDSAPEAQSGQHAGPSGNDGPSSVTPAAPAAGSGSVVSNNNRPGGAGAAGSNGGAEPGGPGSGAGTPTQPATGTSDFVSADTQRQGGSAQGRAGGVATADNAAAPPTAAPAPTTPAAGAASTAMRTVERGDIYRVLPDQRILNLNSYRGVQLLDVSDLSHPRVEGRLAVAGSPVELYVVEDRAIVLLNNWQGYYGERDDVNVESVQGGLVMSVDIRDRAHPKLIAQAAVPGNISTSRLTQGGGQAALYVAATNYNQSAQAVVKSFDVSSGELIEKSQLDLGGYVQDIQATTDLLMVASNDYNKNQSRSEVALIDISRPDGTMVKGGTVLAQGIVQSKFNMDAYNGVLRVVSGATWNGALTNHVETFDLRDLQKLTKLDDCTFGRRDPSGQSEMLYATVFVGERAFFVTYYRRDPFHAFSIDAQGQCQEHAEFIVSGWNDFLRATMDDTRLIGIGHNDQNNTVKLSVSLYDASNLSNPNPLKARADIDLAYGYSEASWDDRGFSVLDDAVSVKAADGTTETGLVLLPFQGWNQNTQENVAEVQIFTFSDHTLTLRGTMDHGTPVRRSFEVKAATTANLSEEQLSLFDTANPDEPKELGRVDVAPNYTKIFVYGDHVARLRERTNYYNIAANNQSREPLKSTVQVLARSADVDGSDVIASFDVPAGTTLYQVGELLVSVYTDVNDVTTKQNQVTYHSKVQVFDLSDPTQPRSRGTLDTDRIEPNYGGYYPAGTPAVGVAIDCFDCGGFYPYRTVPQAFVVPDAVVFQRVTQQQKSLGFVHQCYEYPTAPPCAVDRFGNSSCPNTYYSGGITCSTPAGGQESCSGEFYRCDANGACEVVKNVPSTTRNCSDYEQFRYWTAYSFDPLDLRKPDAPVVAPALDLGKNEEGTSVIAHDATLYFNYQQQHSVKGDPRSFVKHYVRLLNFSNPAEPVRGEAVNIPGDVIAVDGDTLYTRDFVWNNADARTLVARLTLRDNLAHLQASQLFADRNVSAVEVDGAGHVLVSSDPVYSGRAVPPVATSPASPGSPPIEQEQPKYKLSILDAQSLKTVSEADVDTWATFKDANAGRALFQVSGGLLVFNVQDAAHPKAQAYFPTQGWPSEVFFDGNDILFAAGAYGVYRFDANEFNLLTK